GDVAGAASQAIAATARSSALRMHHAYHNLRDRDKTRTALGPTTISDAAYPGSGSNGPGVVPASIVALLTPRTALLIGPPSWKRSRSWPRPRPAYASKGRVGEGPPLPHAEISRAMAVA